MTLATDADFVERRTIEAHLADGTRVRIRPIEPGDKQALADGFDRMSPESRYRRFMSPIDELTPDMLRHLTEVDHVDHFAWIAFAIDEPGEPGVGVARYVRLAGEPTVAEAAVTVIDEFQGRGLGTLLLQALGAVAIENGIERFRGYVLEDNRRMRQILEESGAIVAHDAPGVVRVDVPLPVADAAIKETEAYRALSALARGEGPRLLRWGALWSPPDDPSGQV